MEDYNVNARRALNWDKPAVSIAPELLIRIFFLVLQSHGHDSPHLFNEFYIESMERERCALMVVCSQWHQVVVSSQILWTGIMIGPRRRRGFSNDAFVRGLARSGGSLLSLAVAVPLAALDWEDEIMNGVQSALPRCKHIFITGEPMFMGPFLTLINNTPNANLQSLSMSCSSVLHRDPTNPHPIFADLSSLPSLRDLRLDFAYLGGGCYLKISPEARLRTLELSGAIVPQNIMEVVARSDLLEEWAWDTFDLTMPEPVTFSPVDMPSLRRLSFYGELQFPFLSMLHAPELVALDLIYQPERGFWRHPQLPTLLSPLLDTFSFPRLQVLALDGFPGMLQRNEPSLVKFFRNHPTLQFVSLSEHINEPLAEAISALPSLVHLNLSGVQGSDTHLQGWSFVRRWHAKATDNPRWSSPTLYDGGMWKDLEALSIPEELEGEAELCEFAQRVVLHPSKHVFRRQYGRSIAHWRNLLELCGSEPL